MMSAVTPRRAHEPSFLAKAWDLLRTELAPFPGRANFMLRLLVANSLVILIGMTLQLPMTILAVVAVISVIQTNMVLTRLVGLLMLVALVIAIGTTLLLVKFAIDYPLLRIVAASIIYFGCMWMFRANKLGVIFSGVGLVVIYAQSMLDTIGNPELLTRFILWAMVATAHGTIVALLVNSFVLPRSPGQVMADEAHVQLEEARARLDALASGAARAAAPESLRALQNGMDKLQKQFQFACMNAPHDEAGKLYRQSWIGVVSRVRYGVGALPADIVRSVPAYVLRHLSLQLNALDAAIASNAPFRFDCPPEHRALLERNVDTVAVLAALDAFAQFNASDAAKAAPEASGEAPKEALWQPDARTNPHYVQFALKTLIASLIGYCVYASAHWDGIHTIMISVSLLVYPTLGMALQRMPLRLAGAALGALLAIALTVFVVPHLDGIVGFLLMLAPVFLIGGWIGGGPERTGYIGIQMIGTCCLPLVEGFGPSYDLTEVRDRAVGIVLGVVISAIVFSCLWPESERGALRQKLAALMRQIGSLIRADQQGLGAGERQTALVQAWSTLNECDAMYERTLYESDFRTGPKAAQAQHARTMLDRARRILLAQDDVHSALAASGERAASIGTVLDQTGAALDRYADDIEHEVDPKPLQPQLPIAALDAMHASQPARDAVLTRVRRLLGEVAGLPDNAQPSPVSPSSKEGPAP